MSCCLSQTRSCSRCCWCCPSLHQHMPNLSLPCMHQFHGPYHACMQLWVLDLTAIAEHVVNPAAVVMHVVNRTGITTQVCNLDFIVLHAVNPCAIMVHAINAFVLAGVHYQLGCGNCTKVHMQACEHQGPRAPIAMTLAGMPLTDEADCMFIQACQIRA